MPPLSREVVLSALAMYNANYSVYYPLLTLKTVEEALLCFVLFSLLVAWIKGYS
jgi:hypothetical protein